MINWFSWAKHFLHFYHGNSKCKKNSGRKSQGKSRVWGESRWFVMSPWGLCYGSTLLEFCPGAKVGVWSPGGRARRAGWWESPSMPFWLLGADSAPTSCGHQRSHHWQQDGLRLDQDGVSTGIARWLRVLTFSIVRFYPWGFMFSLQRVSVVRGTKFCEVDLQHDISSMEYRHLCGS